MATIPVVDVPYEKLAQWLAERRVCDPDWSVRLKALGSRVAAAVALVQEQEHFNANEAVRNLITQKKESSIDYGTCVSLLEACEDAERQERNGASITNLFGRYNSAVLHALYSCIKQYRKNYLYLTEASRSMVQHIKYDIPALESDMDRCRRQMQDCSRKASDYDKMVKKCQREYEAAASELGVSTSDAADAVRGQLIRQTKTLPELLQSVLDHTQSECMDRAIQYYRELVEYTIDKSESCNRSGSEIASSLLVTLSAMRDQKTATRNSDIVATPDIAAEPIIEGSAVDWNIADEVVSETDMPAIEVDWNIVTENSGIEDDEEWEITVEDGGTVSEEICTVKDGPHTAVDAEQDVSLSLLDSGTRLLFRTDLLELQAFLSRRHQELEQTSASLFVAAPRPVREHDHSLEVAAALASVQEVLQHLQAPHLQRLLLIHSSSAYLDRLSRDLNAHLLLARTFSNKQALMLSRERDSAAELAELRKQLSTKLQASKRLKLMAEEALSGIVGQGRTVNLTGHIGAVLRSHHI